MNISQYYKILNIPVTASNEVITSSYKKLAQKYHPDKNRDRIKWANETMTKLNIAYAGIMSYRFQNDVNKDSNNDVKKTKSGYEEKKERPEKKRKQTSKKTRYHSKHEIDREILINRFIKFREAAKDSLYQFFQYGLYNIPRREIVQNRGTFNKIVFSLRRTYHSIKLLSSQTDDPELLEHFTVFNKMIFNFYMASECLNIIDSYNNQIDVDAYRSYKNGDEALHQAHKEIFYDRHNRGFIKKEIAMPYIIKSENIFSKTLNFYPESSWSIETNIKLKYVQYLKRYMELFFSEE